jgi:regulator of protease activity HflC (stomatin/prohibitin superfamily)
MFESSTPSGPRFKARFSVPKFAALSGSGFVRKLLKLALFVAPFVLFRACFLSYVPPDQIGLRQISFGPGRGLQKELVGSGYRRQVFGYETIRTFPRDVQAVEFTNDETERGADHRTIGAINVPTVDGYPVAIDLTVLYRIRDPFLVVSRFGFGKGYEDNVVIRFSDPAIKQHLGELRAEEFYRERRLVKMQDVKRDLSRRFQENGLQLADVILRQYDYPATFQQLTEQKKIQDQSVLTNRALAKQAEVETRLKQVSAEGQNSISVRSAEFQAQITGLNAQRDFYERSKHAEADLLVRSAEAQGTQLINTAMEGAGSDKLLKLRKGLTILNGIKGPIYISEDPTDLSKLSSNH